MDKLIISKVVQPEEPKVPEMEPGRKRVFSEDFKRRAVAYYDSLPEDGSKGAYLRRSGIYSSSISQWRESFTKVSETTIGRKPIDLLVRENAALKGRVAKLEAEVRRANTVIDVKKKFPGCLRACRK